MPKKAIDVNKFGGIEGLGRADLYGHKHDVNTIETQSATTLEQDMGSGAAAIIRQFVFAMNPEVFNKAKPTKQQLFNAHIKGIEVMLWKDGLTIMTEVEPRILMDKTHYRIFVGARPSKGQSLYEIPKTLKQIAHGD